MPARQQIYYSLEMYFTLNFAKNGKNRYLSGNRYGKTRKTLLEHWIRKALVLETILRNVAYDFIKRGVPKTAILNNLKTVMFIKTFFDETIDMTA